MKPKAMDCPRCGNPIGPQARHCPCGWHRTENADMPRGSPCSHDGCPHLAQIRQRTKTGWANLCDQHYLEHHHRSAAAWSTQHGLDRRADEPQKEWRQRTLEYVSLEGKTQPRQHISEYLTKLQNP